MKDILPPFTWAVLITTGWSWFTPWPWWADTLVFIVSLLVGGVLNVMNSLPQAER